MENEIKKEGTIETFQVPTIQTDLCDFNWTDRELLEKARIRAAKLLRVLNSFVSKDPEGEIGGLADSGEVYRVKGSSTEERSYIIPEDLLWSILTDTINRDYLGCRDILLGSNTEVC